MTIFQTLQDSESNEVQIAFHGSEEDMAYAQETGKYQFRALVEFDDPEHLGLQAHIQHPRASVMAADLVRRLLDKNVKKITVARVEKVPE